MALVNVWHLRKVAESSARSCDICYKPTTSVLITPDHKDHFYVCVGHLKDKGFASPIIDAEEAVAKKKEEMDREIELIKKEYEEKLKKKKNKKKDKTEDEKGKDREDKKQEEDDDAKAEKEKDDKIKAITNKDAAASPTVVTDDTPRIYALQKVFYHKRLDRIRNAEIARRNQERMRNPSLFPIVPTGDP